MESICQLLEKLISYNSISPNDRGCQDFMIDFFSSLGFVCQKYDQKPVSNFFARYGRGSPLLVFAGHTDVVPVGDETMWHSNPFSLSINNNLAYGRGSADMKGSLASMMIMAKEFINNHPNFSGSLGFLITSGEEGDDFDKGTPYIMSELYKQNIKIDFCIVGEPSSSKKIADTIKIGRRGSLTGQLTLHGKQGHVAYPHLAINPIHILNPVLNKLINTSWDNGNEYFPPTSFQITYINSGGEANNIIPGLINLNFNFRFSTEQTSDGLKSKIYKFFAEHNLKPLIDWRLNGEPFLTSKGKLLDCTINAITAVTQQDPSLSTSGGTSDGRFIAPYGVEIIELGPINATIHQVNECVSLSDLDTLRNIYYNICAQILTPS